MVVNWSYARLCNRYLARLGLADNPLGMAAEGYGGALTGFLALSIAAFFIFGESAVIFCLCAVYCESVIVVLQIPLSLLLRNRLLAVSRHG